MWLLRSASSSLSGKIGVMASLVLVVDDNAAFRNLASRILTSWGHDVIEAGSAAEAVSRVAECRPQAALVDVGLPDGNGFDLAQELLDSAPNLRVVLISTDSDAGNGFDAQRVGASGFFAKDELTSPALKQLLSDV
jgi:CheY-like chemotaxis protein